MKELTLKIDSLIDKELKNYLLSINGISGVDINYQTNEIYIKYDSNLISLKPLKMEILLFLDILKIPSIIAFDKHTKNKTEKYQIIIKDLCCEYCLNGMIDDLLMIDGIENASSNFDYHNKKDIAININYDNKLISEEKIRKIESELNS